MKMHLQKNFRDIFTSAGYLEAIPMHDKNAAAEGKRGL